MIISPDTSSKLAIDTKSINDLHLLAKQNPDEALHQVAQQFEAIFMHMLLKSMRDATPKDGLFDSQQTQFITQMYDQQLAQHISSKGVGIADMMVKQLARANDGIELETSFNKADAILTTINTISHSPIINNKHPNDTSRQLWANSQASTNSEASLSTSNFVAKESSIASQSEDKVRKLSNNSSNFIDKLLPHAKNVSQTTGIPPHFMLAQAALESGWGKHEIRRADNSPSYNLFGIKAGTNWKGDVVETITTEYVNGNPRKMIEKFRAYNSYAEAFNDYARLLLDNPRYINVVKSNDAATFANGLQRAGYATDPLYAEKLIRILNSEILQRREVI
ncbi:MAG: flagellar assembly peptidoglycan hydrolase FlgJ [Nitrosomonas sp. PRO4]|nr:flagellar assembly peptidoglycan hydrolase FlgJ [Nitrosomonas sp. PRO4]